jgi:hypothetical protein
MSTTVAHPGATGGAGGSNRLLGVAAAGLAAAIVIGIVFAATQGNPVAPMRPRPAMTDVQSAHPMVSDSHRVKAEQLAERRAEAAAQAAANRFPMIGGETSQMPKAAQSLPAGRGAFPVFGGASTQVPEVAQSQLSNTDAVGNQWLADYQEYADFLAERAQPEHSKQQAMWEQRYDDLVERFQGRYEAGNRIDDTLIGYK